MLLGERRAHRVGDLSVGTNTQVVGEEEPLLFAMDVAYTPTALERGIQAGFHHTPVDGVRSIARVKQVAEETGARIFYSHDMDEWSGYRHAPEHYDV